MKAFAGVLLCLPFVAWAVVRIVLYILFGIYCGGHMERAGHANSIELARQEMAAVVKYAEEKGLTEGYTSILYRTPDADVGFWYNNMKTSLNELQNVKADASDLEKSNILIKLRETVCAHGKSDEHIVVPAGISVFPNNVIFCFWGVLSGIVAIGGCVLLVWFFVVYFDD
jgi:hypothetical protein